MKLVKKIFLIILISHINFYPCTTGIITAKASKDGRPILFKHRDSDYEQNRLMYFTDGKYNYIGLVNSEDVNGKEVWGGSNSAGFAIINSASYNLKDPNDKTVIKDMEGVLMKEALQNCATVDEFEKFLSEHKKPLGVEANFGVIDAKGNAAYFECDNFSFKKFDANNPQIAPNGYLIRTNYSLSGRENQGYGYIRYQNAEELLLSAAKANQISVKFILQNLSRSLKHSLTNIDLNDKPLADETENIFVPFEDFIPRNSSTSTILIQGVKFDESPTLTTIWTLLGFPLSTVAFPVWVEAGKNLPSLLFADSNNIAPLCDKSIKLKAKLFPINRGSGYKYLNLSALMNKQNTGILQKIIPIENEIFEKAYKLQEKLYSAKSIDKISVEKFYHWANQFISNEYQKQFKL